MVRGDICHAILILSLCDFTIADDSFECGFTRCSRRHPYQFCVGPPLISEGGSPYCLNCESQQTLCGTDKQQAGCDLYCEDYLAEKRKGNCEDQNVQDNSCDGGPTICFNRKWFIGVCTSVAGLVLILISCLAFLMFKNRKKRKDNSDLDVESSSFGKEDCQSLEKETGDDTHETSVMLPKTSPENPTDGDDPAGVTYSTGDQCSTDKRYPTDGNPSDDFNLRKIKAIATNNKNAEYVPS